MWLQERHAAAGSELDRSMQLNQSVNHSVNQSADAGRPAPLRDRHLPAETPRRSFRVQAKGGGRKDVKLCEGRRANEAPERAPLAILFADDPACAHPNAPVSGCGQP
jgi:hypothetical protein